MDYSAEQYQEMQRRLRKLKDAFESGAVQFAPAVAKGFKKSLDRVRYKADGDIDLDTVDARVRVLALSVTVMSDREEVKKHNPLREIQRAYFDYVERNFGEYHKAMTARGLTPHQAGTIAGRSAEAREHFKTVAPKIFESIKQIWTYVNDPCRYHLEDLHCLKGVFGGDILPSYTHNIASSCGLYLDTILLPDPFLKIGPLFERWNDRDRAYYFIKHAMILLNYKELALADVDPPIVAIVPDGFSFDEDERKLIWQLGEQDGVKHASLLFGEKFGALAEVVEFTSKLKTIDRVVSAVRDPSRLLFDTDWKGSLADQVDRAMKHEYARVGMKLPVGQMIAMQCVSRMVQANDVLYNSQHLRGVPLIDAPTSWRYLTWKLEYDNRAAHGIDSTSSQIVAGLQEAVAGKMRWLGNIPPAALIELRKTGGIEEIRSVLRKGISDLETMNEDAFKSGASLVVENLKSAFAAHEKALDKIKAKGWKFARSDIGSWLAIGTVEIAAAATGAPLFGLSAFIANQLFDVPKLKDLIPKAKALKQEMDKRKKSPVGLVFAHKR